MARYIDADKFLKSMIAKFKCVPLIGVTKYIQGEESFYGEDLKTLIDHFPTADVVEVVRCKDCTFSGRYTSGRLYCTNQVGLSFPKENTFCSYGERKMSGK